MLRKRSCAILAAIILSISGCANSVKETSTEGTETEEASEDVISITRKSDLKDLDAISDLVNQFGKNGYSAIDSKNQIDMVNPQSIEKFCESVENKENAKTRLFNVVSQDTVVRYEFITQGGKVEVTSTDYQYQNEEYQKTDSSSFTACIWSYTKEGYLFFEEYHPPGYDGPSGHHAVRVQPLDATCREMNRKYILPIGYYLNNMFIVDWNEENYENLDFYDLYDILYPLMNPGKHVPYTADDNFNVGSVYQIPKEEFENVIMSYFPISSDTLQEKTTYLPEQYSYEYRPRGLYDAECPKTPYPEVVKYTENEDGTITLRVNAVYPDENCANKFSHEVVVRQLPDGKFQYVSNRIVSTDGNPVGTWHVNRLSKKEWEAAYKNN